MTLGSESAVHSSPELGESTNLPIMVLPNLESERQIRCEPIIGDGVGDVQIGGIGPFEGLPVVDAQLAMA